MYKTIQSGLPRYNSVKLEESRPHRITDMRATERYRVDYNLSVSRCSYFYRGSRLINLLPENVFQAKTLPTFKKRAKAWVQNNIPVLPP